MALIDVNTLQLAFSRNRLQDLADDGNGYDVTIIQAAIEAASSEVRDALSFQYDEVTLASSQAVKDIVAALAAYRLEARRGLVPADVEARHRTAQALLMEMQEGRRKPATAPQILPRISYPTLMSTRRLPSLESGLFAGIPEGEH